MSKLEVLEGAQDQSTDEQIVYKLTTTPWGTSPATISAVAYDLTTRTTVTTTVFPTNTPSASGDIISLSALRSLTKNHQYRIEVKFTANSNVFECYFIINCTM
jgi:hypothetical protein